MQQIIQLATPIGVIAILAYIIYQLLDRFVFSKPLSQRINKIETNHLGHITADIREIKNEQILQGNRITRLETIIQDKLSK